MATSICIRKCRERLERALDGIVIMEKAKTYSDAERGWSEFLLAVSAIYSKIEQGTKGKGATEAWFGRVKKERKDDHLLSYLHHARNSDEHSIDEITGVIDYSYRLHEEVQPEPGVREFSVEHIDAPSWILVPVKDDRYGDIFNPPGWHMGRALIDESPLNVARVGLHYVQLLVETAEALGV